MRTGKSLTLDDLALAKPKPEGLVTFRIGVKHLALGSSLVEPSSVTHLNKISRGEAL